MINYDSLKDGLQTSRQWVSDKMNGTTHLGDFVATQAQLNLTAAYHHATGRTVDAITAAGNPGGQTLVIRLTSRTLFSFPFDPG